jgi:hypothetical protein
VNISERVYRILLRFYPRRFLDDYRETLQQAFRDQLRDADTQGRRVHLWVGTVIDVVRSVPAVYVNDKRSLRMKLTTLAAYLSCVAAMIFLGRFELRTDDAGVVVLFILVITFILGWLHPRRAWLWPFAGWCVPAVHLFWRTANSELNGGSGILILTAFVTFIGFAGSYSGALLRKIVMRTLRG